MRREIKSNCSFCSLACPLVVCEGERGPIFGRDSLLSVEWDRSPGSKYGGSLCARGNAMAEFLSHQKRVNYPYILGERTNIAAAVRETAKSLAEIKSLHGADSIGLLLGENLTIEEASLAVRFAREVIGTNNIALFAPDDVPIFRAYLQRDFSGIKQAGSKPSGDRVVSLVFGDPFSEHPCTAKEILPGKYGSRGSEVIVVSPDTNHSAWFANRHLRCRPGGEAAVAAGLLKAAVEIAKAELPKDLQAELAKIGWNDLVRLGGVPKEALTEAAKSMLGAAKIMTYISNIFARMGAPALVFSFAEALTQLMPGERQFFAQFVHQNTWGIYSAIEAAGSSDCIKKLGAAELRGLVILGLDLFSAYPAAPIEKAMREKRFTVTTQLFWNQTAERANIVVPAASLMEKAGTVSPAFGQDIVREEAIRPLGGSIRDADFLCMVAKEMGHELTLESVPRRKTERGSSTSSISGEWSEYASWLSELESAGTILIPWSEAVHLADGSLSRNFHWSQITCPDAKLMVSKAVATKLGISKDGRIDISTSGGEIVLAAEATDRLPENIVAATIHFPSVRKLFPWRLSTSGEIVLGPVAARLSRQRY